GPFARGGRREIERFERQAHRTRGGQMQDQAMTRFLDRNVARQGRVARAVKRGGDLLAQIHGTFLPAGGSYDPNRQKTTRVAAHRHTFLYALDVSRGG